MVSCIFFIYILKAENNSGPSRSSNNNSFARPEQHFRKIPDVPECYNYGVYYDDGYDYTKHMKTMKEFVEDPEFVSHFSYLYLPIFT